MVCILLQLRLLLLDLLLRIVPSLLHQLLGLLLCIFLGLGLGLMLPLSLGILLGLLLNVVLLLVGLLLRLVLALLLLLHGLRIVLSFLLLQILVRFQLRLLRIVLGLPLGSDSMLPLRLVPGRHRVGYWAGIGQRVRQDRGGPNPLRPAHLGQCHHIIDCEINNVQLLRRSVATRNDRENHILSYSVQLYPLTQIVQCILRAVSHDSWWKYVNGRDIMPKRCER